MCLGEIRPPHRQIQSDRIAEVADEDDVGGQEVLSRFCGIKPDGKEGKCGQKYPPCGNQPFFSVWLGIAYFYGVFLSNDADLIFVTS
jgi:hypothetical protein